MLAKIGFTLLISVSILLTFPTHQGFAGVKKKLEAFDIAADPTPKDWKYFLATSEKNRENLWDYQSKRGKKLDNWSWGWRIGWVKSCATSKRPFCRFILKNALIDNALVVRAEAVTIIGLRYENTKNTKVIKLLSKAYKNKQNLRNGKPMFIQKRILYALKLIGGKKAFAIATRLSKHNPVSNSYWQRLSNAEKIAPKAAVKL